VLFNVVGALVTTSHNDHTQPEANKDKLLTRWLCTQGANQDQLLAVAAVLTSEIREAVQKETGFTCSAGISYKKVSYITMLRTCP